jgi:hypothetical protein
MPSLRNLLLLSLPILCHTIAQPAPEASHNPLPDQLALDFQELLNAIPEESIHAALHKHLDAKYKDGVWEHDRSAIEAVHHDDPPTATKLLVGAALDLIKRQANSTATSTGTTAAAAPPASTSSTSTAAAVVVPVEVATTNSAGSTSTLTTSAVVSQASVSVVVTATTTNAAGSTIVSQTTVAGAVVTENGKATTSPVPTFNADPTKATTVTTTDAKGNTLVLSNVKSGQVLTTTDGAGSTLVTTFTPGGGKVSMLVLQTTTLPNGEATTVTSFAEVQLMTETAGGSAGSTPQATPKLQNGGDSLKTRGFSGEAIALVGAAIGVAILL